MYHIWLKLYHWSITYRKNHIIKTAQQAGRLQYAIDYNDGDHNNKIKPYCFAGTAFKK